MNAMLRLSMLLVLATLVIVACGGGAPEEEAGDTGPAEPTGRVLATVSNPNVGRATLPPQVEPTATRTLPPTTPTLTRTPLTTGLPTRVTQEQPTATDEVLDAPTPIPTVPTVGGGTGELVFQSSRAGQFALFMVDTNGENIRQLTTVNEFSGRPHFSSNGTSIAFVGRRPDDEEIYVIDLNDLNTEFRITNYVGPDRAPRYGPDGVRILFESDRDFASFDIYLYNNGQTINLTQGQGQNFGAVWSADGERIAFVSTRAGRPDVYTMAADGTDVQPVGFEGILTDWSADGQFYLYHRDTGNGNNDIFLVQTNPLAEQNLTNTPDFDEEFAVFSPDEQWIAYHSNNTTDFNDDIFIQPVAGGDAINVTNNFGEDRYPAWRPLVPESDD